MCKIERNDVVSRRYAVQVFIIRRHKMTEAINKIRLPLYQEKWGWLCIIIFESQGQTKAGTWQVFTKFC